MTGDQQQDITDAVAGTIDTTSTAADNVTTATAPDNVVTTVTVDNQTASPAMSALDQTARSCYKQTVSTSSAVTGEQQQDITDAVAGTIDTTSTAADDVTTATAPDNVVTTSQAAAATTNPGLSLCYLAPSPLPHKLLMLLLCCTTIVS